jgi:amino acid transporter
MSSHKATIGLATATAVCLNAMIGSGIFTAPVAIASSVGPAGILAYLFVGIAVWCLAFAFARLAQLFPGEGSFYRYASQWMGHKGGLLVSGMYLIGLTVAMGMLCHICSFYLVRIFPGIPLVVLGSCSIIVLTFLNMLGVQLSSFGQQILLVCTLFPLCAITILCLCNAHFSYLTPFAPYGFKNILEITRVVIFGFLGFECASSLFGIVEDAPKNVPRAISYSVIIIVIIYTLFVASLILAVPLYLFADATKPLPEVLLQVLPNYGWLINLSHFTILSAIVGTLHSMIWSSSTLLHSLMHRIPFMHKFLSRINHSYQHPLMVTAIGGAILFYFLFLHDLNFFFSAASALIVGAMCLSVVALLFVRGEWTSGRNGIVLVGLATACVILYFSLQGIWDALKLFI